MLLKGFVGPSYTSRSVQAECEQSKNLIPELIESGMGKNSAYLYGRPGLLRFLTLDDSPTRGLFYQDGRAFAVAGAHFYEWFNTGQFTRIGAVALSGSPASFSTNGSGGHQIFVTSGGKGYVFDLNTGIFTQVTVGAFPIAVTMTAFLDSYTLVLNTDSNQFQLSDFEDSLVWSGLDVAQRSAGSDILQALVVDHREIWLFGSKTTEVWYNSGAANFPFQPISGAFLQIGAVAWTVQRINNSLTWLSMGENGHGMVMRANGWNPERISTHAVEWAFDQYATIADAESFSYQLGGHSFYVLNFPTAQATWVFDASTNLWHEEDFFNVQTGVFEAHRARNHAFAWEKHFVGDRQTGDIYLMGPSYLNDNGVSIRKRRRAPHLCDEKHWTFYSQFELDMKLGGGIPGAALAAPDPLITLRWSDDGAETWSSDYTVSAGKLGKRLNRAQWSRLGRSRDRVYEVEIDDDIDVVLVNAYIDIVRGNGG